MKRMLLPGGSAKVVLAALAGNVAVAVTKFAAFGLTRSTAMLTEAIHSLVDTADQVVLLIGERRGARPADDSHPFGYGMEIYFWSFIVALMIFTLGGAVSVWEGIEKIHNPARLSHPWVNLLVLGVSALFEASSFRVAYRRYRAIAQGRTIDGRKVGLLRFLSISKDPSLYTTLLEDGAALLGLAIAALGTVGAGWLGLGWADGAASALIGLLLIVVAGFMANETRSLIAGESAAQFVVVAARAAVEGDPRVAKIIEVASLQLGPANILLAVTLVFRPGQSGEAVQAATDDLVARAQGADPRIRDVFVRPRSDGVSVAEASRANLSVPGS